jgi:hypothetical protein
MLSGAPLGDSPLFATLFANRPVDKGFEAVFNPISNVWIRLGPIQCFNL